MHLEGTARPVNVVLNEMEKVRQKDKSQKLNPNRSSFNLNHDKKKGRPKIFRQHQVVKWKFIHDAKIPRIMDMENYLKTTKPQPIANSSSQWNFAGNFSSDDSLDRILKPEEVRWIKVNKFHCISLIFSNIENVCTFINQI